MATRRSDSGQTLVVVALAIPVLLGFLGLGIDMGYMRYVKRQVQMAADAAAIAAADEITNCGSGPNCTALQNAVLTAVQGQGCGTSTIPCPQAIFPNVTQGTGCSPAPAVGATIVLVNQPPTCLNSTANDPHYSNKNYVETIVAENVPTLFSAIFGVKSATITARAEGGIGGTTNCVYALDQTASGAFTSTLTAYSTPSCGLIVESNSSSAFDCNLLDYISAPYIGVVGGVSGSLFGCLWGNAKPTKISDPNPHDPLQYRQQWMESAAPSPTSCGNSLGSPYHGHNGATGLVINGTNSSSGSPALLYPGTYCGGISIQPGGYATFEPGVFTLTSSVGSGGLTIDPGTTVNGNGVAFYNYGPSGAIRFTCASCTAGHVTLTAPTDSGDAYEGILFFQNPQDTAASQVFGSVSLNTTIEGITYLPTAPAVYAFDFTVNQLSANGYSHPYNGIVADTITFGLTLSLNGGGKATIGTNNYDDYTLLPDGSPMKGNAGVLEE